MKISTIVDKNKSGKIQVWAVGFWLICWQLASMYIGQEILLVSPVSVVCCLGRLIQTKEFYASIGSSLSKIAIGFSIAFMLGIILAMLSKVSYIIKSLIHPLIQVMKTVPVASFIILCLVWIPSKNLSIFISFLIVFPIIYTNTLQGIDQTDSQLLEMAKLFQLSNRKKIQYIYVSQVMPYLTSACSISLGMCWKSGIAAEIIGLPKGSIGEKLYQAKIYLETPDLFAWTVVIVTISIIFERVILKVLHYITRRLETI